MIYLLRVLKIFNYVTYLLRYLISQYFVIFDDSFYEFWHYGMIWCCFMIMNMTSWIILFFNCLKMGLTNEICVLLLFIMIFGENDDDAFVCLCFEVPASLLSFTWFWQYIFFAAEWSVGLVIIYALCSMTVNLLLLLLN